MKFKLKILELEWYKFIIILIEFLRRNKSKKNIRIKSNA